MSAWTSSNSLLATLPRMLAKRLLIRQEFSFVTLKVHTDTCSVAFILGFDSTILSLMSHFLFVYHRIIHRMGIKEA